MSWRRTRTLSAAASAVLALITLAGCGPAAQPSQPPTPTSSTAEPAKTLPSRPREVRLNGIDPCTLITPKLRAELGELNDHFSHEKAFDSLASSNCAITNVPHDPGYVLSLRLVTAQGADFYLASPKITVTSVNGFGSLDQPGLNDLAENRSCLVIVDVAQGQSLWVGFNGSNDTPPPGGYQAMCSKAHIAAESIMQQLLEKTS
jgi:Protein of unknown function (DUF3558)